MKRSTKYLPSPLELVPSRSVIYTSSDHVFLGTKGCSWFVNQTSYRENYVMQLEDEPHMWDGFKDLKNRILIKGPNDFNFEFYICDHCVYEKQNDV